VNIYTCAPLKVMNASVYYRQYLPLDVMDKLNIGANVIFDPYEASIPPLKRAYAMAYSDVNLLYQPYGAAVQLQLEISKKWVPAIGEDQQVRFPPSWVIDTDDNLFNVSPFNPSFQIYGYSIDGVDIPPDTEMRVKTPEGEDKVIWTEGVEFSALENKTKLMQYKATLELSDGVTCSTPEVAKYVKEAVPHANTFVYPNCIDFDSYPAVELAPHPKEVRIMWQGSDTHYEDLFPLYDSILELTNRYPQVQWIFWGAVPPQVYAQLPENRYRVLPWVLYAEYKVRLATINHDINIVPLKPTLFNNSRSGIKWYESSAIHKPAATVAQRVPSYSEIEDGVTGLLFDTPAEFVQQVSRLIENATERKQMAANAHEWMRQNRDVYKIVPSLYNFYTEMREANIKRLAPKTRKPRYKALPSAEIAGNGDKKWRSSKPRRSPSRKQKPKSRVRPELSLTPTS
jgi:glycosyltransferase involved in cell wall biosynthesis